MQKVDPLFSSAQSNILKYLDPWIIFSFAKNFGPPELKFLNYLDHLEIFYPFLICIKCTVQWG